MINSLKDKVAKIFWEFVISLIDTVQEIKDGIINQKPRGSIRKIMKEINSKPFVFSFWIILRKDERLFDFLKDQFGSGEIGVIIQKGQYRLERKMVKWGSNNVEMPWLVLENTTIGARESWWQKQSDLSGIPLKLDADL